MNTDSIDPGLYQTLPKMNIASAYSLGCALIAASPKGLPALPRKALAKVRSSVLGLREAWIERSMAAKAEDKRPADLALDTAWSACQARAESYTWLPADRYPEAVVAAEVRDIAFPDGLGFLKLAYEQQWAESERRLAALESSGRMADFERIVGADLLAELRRTHAEYGRVLGITKAAEPTTQVYLADRLVEVRVAMASYVLKVLATVDDDDPSSVESARRALRPIDVLRSSQAKRGASGASEPEVPTEPVEPVPELPPVS